jgi:hypothetical protein
MDMPLPPRRVRRVSWRAQGTRRQRLNRPILGALVVTVALLGSTASASASTFFVATTGNNANDCLSASTACLTIAGAITKARLAPDVATINIGPGTFTEDVSLNTAADDGTALVGSGSGAGGTVIQGVAGSQTVLLGAASVGNSLAHLKVLSASTGTDNGVSVANTSTLTDVAIDMHTGSTGSGMSVGTLPVKFTGGSVTMESGSGVAMTETVGGLTVAGSTVTVADGATGPGIVGSIGPLTVTGSTVTMGNMGASAISTGTGVTTISDTTIVDGGAGSTAISAAISTVALTNVGVTMTNAPNPGAAISIVQSGATLDHVTVSGAWKGPGLIVHGSAIVRDSRLTSSAASTSPLAEMFDAGAAGRSALFQRSVLAEMAPGQPNLIADDADLALDSSELLGGTLGVLATHSTGKPRVITVAGSTIDAGALGVRDALPTGSISTTVGGTAGSTLDVRDEGSILVDPQIAVVAGAGSTTTVTCTASDAPDQTQAADATHGAINCGAGSNGNTVTDPLTSLFANPVATPPDYGLVASSSAVDAVPASAISLPAGSASATDLAGNPRVADGNGDCVPTQDKGALELQGHAGVVPAPVISGPSSGTAGVPVALSVASPNEPAGVSYSWVFSDGASPATGPSVSPKFASAGPATATVTASAGGGCVASASKSLTIAAAIKVDHISKLKVSPSTLVAASKGASVAAAKKKVTPGAIVSYTGSQPATTRFSVQRRTTGRRVGKSCVKATSHNKTKRACTRYVAAGSFSHVDKAAGAIRFRFTGRVAGRKLSVASYRLLAVPKNSAGSGKSGTAAFRVKT